MRNRAIGNAVTRAACLVLLLGFALAGNAIFTGTSFFLLLCSFYLLD